LRAELGFGRGAASECLEVIAELCQFIERLRHEVEDSAGNRWAINDMTTNAKDRCERAAAALHHVRLASGPVVAAMLYRERAASKAAIDVELEDLGGLVAKISSPTAEIA
jgi:hypothetical protein